MNATQRPVTSDLTAIECCPPGLPSDLRPLTGECTLLTLALEAATEIADQLPPWRRPQADGSNPRTLLTLLTYSYAIGVCASEDIEANCLEEPATRYLAGNSSPSASLLQAFRRANRPWIELALAHVLARAARGQPASEPDPRPGLPGPDLERGGWLQAARQRVQIAILLDLELAD